MTSRQLSSLGRRYMRKLGMVEWIPKAEFRVVKDLKDDGQSDWHAEERLSWVRVKLDDKRVMKETLVHELLHIALQGHKAPTDVYDEGYEFGLNRLSAALMEAWGE